MSKLLVWSMVAAVALLAVNAHAAAGWETDFEKASAEAKKSGKYMLLDFTGSDWCGWCIKLDKEVWSQGEFKAYAKKNLVPVMLDFPRKKEQSEEEKAQNAKLAKKYSIRGYPTVILLSPEGEMVGKTGYQPGGAEAYVKHLEEFIAKHKGDGDT
jgi:thioredoxin-related protein